MVIDSPLWPDITCIIFTQSLPLISLHQTNSLQSTARPIYWGNYGEPNRTSNRPFRPGQKNRHLTRNYFLDLAQVVRKHFKSENCMPTAYHRVVSDCIKKRLREEEVIERTGQKRRPIDASSLSLFRALALFLFGCVAPRLLVRTVCLCVCTCLCVCMHVNVCMLASVLHFRLFTACVWCRSPL